jgi:preprotein translocase SecE subunit
MAVAVKNPEATSSGLFDRLPVGILAGVVYVVGSLAILFGLLPAVWWQWLGFQATASSYAVLILVGMLLAAGLAYVGMRLLGPKPAPGLKAGIFVALLALLVVLLVTRWVSQGIEGLVYEGSRPLPETLGIALTVAVGLGLLALAFWTFFLKPGAERRLAAFEEQGWFTSASYKRSQGVRVRRGTILGLLILTWSGVWALMSHGALNATRNWAINLPFTGTVTVTAPGDAAEVGFLPDQAGEVVNLHRFNEARERLSKDYVRINRPGESNLDKGKLVRKEDFTKERSRLTEKVNGEKFDTDQARQAALNEALPTAQPPNLPDGDVHYLTLTLLPDVRYTVPLLLAALSLWVAWRVVNVPAFADFLIATEAELNKVSWTTRRRLVQDTIVVLVTVLLMTFFLFGVDVLWGKILALRLIDVLKLPSSSTETQKPEQQPW